jgi:hypothetical protein
MGDTLIVIRLANGKFHGGFRGEQSEVAEAFFFYTETVAREVAETEGYQGCTLHVYTRNPKAVPLNIKR